jgi:putative flippase GtrA
MNYKKIIVELLSRFMISGVVSMAIAYFSLPCIFFLLSFIAANVVNPEIINLSKFIFPLSYFLAIIVNTTSSFVLQRKAVYRSKESWLNEYLKFWTGSLLIIIISLIIFLFLTHVWYTDIFVANIIVVSVSTVLNIIYNALVTFKKSLYALFEQTE